jgi:MioC protein
MAEPIRILVGTMTGTAELVADEISEVFANRGSETEVLLMDGLDAAVFRAGVAYVVCTSTYGQGDVPDNARQLFESLERNRPRLAGIRYGVFALGDTTYAETFCNAGRKFDVLLSELGARRVGPRLEHDASSGSLPEDIAAAWADAWHEALNAAIGLDDATPAER